MDGYKFWTNVLPDWLLPWRNRHKVLPKHPYLSTKLQDLTFQKTILSKDFSQTLVPVYQTTRFDFSEDHIVIRFFPNVGKCLPNYTVRLLRRPYCLKIFPKIWNLCTKLYGVTSQKAILSYDFFQTLVNVYQITQRDFSQEREYPMAYQKTVISTGSVEVYSCLNY
jgi:hypothetical protein